MRSCRACLTYTENVYYHLLDPLCDDEQFIEMSEAAPRTLDCFNKCLQLNVTEKELKSPTWTARYICQGCKVELERVYHFINKAKLSDEILKKRSLSLKYMLKNPSLEDLEGKEEKNPKEPRSKHNDLDPPYNDALKDSAIDVEVHEFDLDKIDDAFLSNDLPVELVQNAKEAKDLDFIRSHNDNGNSETLPNQINILSHNVNQNEAVKGATSCEPYSLQSKPNDGEDNSDFQTEFLSNYDQDEETDKQDLIDLDDDDINEEATLQQAQALNASFESETISIEVPSDLESSANDQHLKFICELCGEEYRFQSHLIQHFSVTHLSEGNYHYQCEECQKFFPTKFVLNIHKRKDHMKIDYKDCPECGKMVMAKLYQKHCYTVHCNRTIFPCPDCLNIYYTKEGLKQHQKVHAEGSRSRQVQCEDCGREFFTLSALNSHMLTHQDERKIFQCAICDKSFLRRMNLKLHMRLHLGATMACPHCNKEFVRRRDLEIHIRFHTNDFPYACPKCDRRFAIRSHLNEHLKAHQGISYDCKVCGKVFKRVASLKHHSYVHSSMPFACKACLKGFPTKFKLRRHLRYVHVGLFPNGYSLQLADSYILQVELNPGDSLPASEQTQSEVQEFAHVFENDAACIDAYLAE